MEGSVKNLLEAETEAQAIIDEANREKDKQLNNARAMANQQVNARRQEHEAHYQRECARIAEENKGLVKYDAEAEKDIEAIQDLFERNKAATVDLLLKNVLDVRLDVPKVVVQNFEETME